MSDRTGHDPRQPRLAPRERQILNERADHQRCDEDYANGAEARALVDHAAHRDLR